MTIDVLGRSRGGFHRHDEPRRAREPESSAVRPYSVAVALAGDDTAV
ncbi:hypothetical protein [Actinomadura madurae]|nr:hypothetical protein [Actinomadura madurae]MCP9951965.1 hypothetical protein [Actinomadura madurae]MCP9968729.1 hypothetical protein [Actinomadura madurae]MCP9981210.1 hypothetical protein [Actinomadura madurae]MCQ0017402.1 hypothetical protein [Actinomadura madurae]URM97507.1 hypothetical protein LUW76_25850 [Actinomadura madurae]